MTSTPPRPKAVVLLSGGLDSATVLAIAKSQGFDLYALSFRYGQRHEHELRSAKLIAERTGVTRHVVTTIDLAAFGGSALTDPALHVPKDRNTHAPQADIPITYVPARNTIFLSFALAFAETIGSVDLFIGVNAIDYSGYPDCRPEYIAAFQHMANLATRAGVQGTQPLTIHTPLIRLSKADIIRTGLALGVDYSLTTTCYDPSPTGLACARCDACQLRLEGFRANALPDPAPYTPPS